MGKLPEVKSEFSELSKLYFGTFASRLMMTAIGLKVFDHLEQPRASGEIAKALASDPGNTELMLNALCACGMINKDNGVYQNRGSGQRFSGVRQTHLPGGVVPTGGPGHFAVPGKPGGHGQVRPRRTLRKMKT